MYLYIFFLAWCVSINLQGWIGKRVLHQLASDMVRPCSQRHWVHPSYLWLFHCVPSSYASLRPWSCKYKLTTSFLQQLDTITSLVLPPSLPSSFIACYLMPVYVLGAVSTTLPHPSSYRCHNWLHYWSPPHPSTPLKLHCLPSSYARVHPGNCKYRLTTTAIIGYIIGLSPPPPCSPQASLPAILLCQSTSWEL